MSLSPPFSSGSEKVILTVHLTWPQEIFPPREDLVDSFRVSYIHINVPWRYESPDRPVTQV